MPRHGSELPVEYVSAEIIRREFNQRQLYERMQRNEFTIYLKRNNHPETPPQGEPKCTHSQIVYYYDQNKNLMAIVHQFLRPDGTLGASGRPDPKVLIVGGRAMTVRYA